MATAQDKAAAELARRELERRRVQTEQAQQGDQLGPIEATRQAVASQALGTSMEGPAAAANAVVRGAQRLGANVADLVGVGSLNPLSNIQQGLEARGEPVPQQLQDVANPQAVLDQFGRIATPVEEALAAQHPFLSAVGQEVPASMVPVGRLSQGAGMLGRASHTGVETAVQGQLASQQDDFDSRLERAGTDSLVGAGFRVAIDTLGGAGKALTKFGIAPKALIKKQAAKDIAKWSNLSADEVAKRNQKVKEVFGDDASLVGLSEVTGERLVANREAAFAAVQAPERQALLAARAQKLDAAVENKLNEFRQFFPLNPDEQQLVKEAYQSLSSVKVPDGRWQDLMNDPIMKEVSRELGQPSFNVSREAITAYPANSVAFWDEVKQFVSRRAWQGDISDPKKVDKYKEFARRINTMNDVAAEGASAYTVARRLSQRKIVGEEIDKVFNRIREGVGPDAPVQRKSVRAALANQNWSRIEDGLKGITDKKTRALAIRNARLLKRFTQELELSLDPGKLARQTEEVQPGGAFSVIGGALGNATKGRYNRAAMDMIENPEKYVEVLRGIENSKPEVLVSRLASVLASASTEEEQQ